MVTYSNFLLNYINTLNPSSSNHKPQTNQIILSLLSLNHEVYIHIWIFLCLHYWIFDEP